MRWDGGIFIYFYTLYFHVYLLKNFVYPSALDEFFLSLFASNLIQVLLHSSIFLIYLCLSAILCICYFHRLGFLLIFLSFHIFISALSFFLS